MILREGRAGKFCRERVFIFSMNSTRKFIFRYTKARLFIFIRNKILKKQKKKKRNQTQPPSPREGGGVIMLVQKGARTRTGFSMGFLFYFCALPGSVCACAYILKYLTELLLKGVLGSSPKIILVFFIQNGVVLGNSNWYTCLDIMPQQEGRLPIYLIRDVQYIVIYIYQFDTLYL